MCRYCLPYRKPFPNVINKYTSITTATPSPIRITQGEQRVHLLDREFHENASVTRSQRPATKRGPLALERGSKLDITCSDGFTLSATLFDPAERTPGRIAIINPGAGIPARYYHKFASWLATRGIPTITYDYRGIGQSCPNRL